MKLYQTLIVVALLFFSCRTPEATDQLHQLMNDYHQQALKLYPLNATYQGDNRYNDYLPNSLSDEFMAKEKSSTPLPLKNLILLMKEV